MTSFGRDFYLLRERGCCCYSLCCIFFILVTSYNPIIFSDLWNVSDCINWVSTVPSAHPRHFHPARCCFRWCELLTLPWVLLAWRWEQVLSFSFLSAEKHCSWIHWLVKWYWAVKLVALSSHLWKGNLVAICIIFSQLQLHFCWVKKP